MNFSCELHDSEVSEIVITDDFATIYFDALYVHESHGKAGIDSGIGYYKKAILKIFDPTVQEMECSEFTIYDGWIRLAQKKISNELPYNTVVNEAAELYFLADTGQKVHIIGTGISCQVSSEASTFIEQFNK